MATLVENTQLNQEESIKDTRHLVVNIEGSGLDYTVGDSLGIFPMNHPDCVDAMLHVLDATGAEPVTLVEGEDPLPFREALTSRLAMGGPTKKVLQALLDHATAPAELDRIHHLLDRENREELKDYLGERELYDLLEDFPSVSLTPQEAVNMMRRLVPRLYSIASSPKLFPTEVHLTVAVVKYETNQRPRYGVGSTFLTERCAVGEPALPVYVASSHFRLPEDADSDVIMVGPGTGIAPFRAFLQEREATGAKGRNWLFFGDQHERCDFLYEADLRGFQERGILNKLDCAWSRDQDYKIYVQDKIRENAQDIWDWLDEGASVYICGDAFRMAKDVEASLLEFIQSQGGMAAPEAKQYLRRLRQEKRYQKDVY